MNPGVHLVTIVKVRKNSDWRRLRPLHVINDNSYCRALLRMTAYPPYGYDNVDGKMVIVPEEAAVVKEIFSWALSGKGSYIIANTLNERGIASKRGAKWHASTVQGILKNEKYTGDVIFQKTFTDERFNRHTNYGEKNMYLCKEHHEAIVTHEIFDKVAEAMNRRGQEKGQGEDTGKYQNRYAFSGRIICGECGSTFKRRNHYKPSGNYIAWSCNGHLKDKDSCRMLYVNDNGIKLALVRMLNKLQVGQRQVIKAFIKGLRGQNDKVGIEKTQSVVGRLIKNDIYLGTEFYPRIIDDETFYKANEIRSNNAKNQNRIRELTPGSPTPTDFNFKIGNVEIKYEDPYQQAEYAYGLIKEILNEG